MKNQEAKEILAQISEKWFMTEPFLFNVLCTHKLEENSKQDCIFRTGRGIIQYNPKRVNTRGFSQAERLLKAEVTRIILKHPYQRVPDFPNSAALTRSSDVTLNQHCDFPELTDADHYKLENGLAYEEYYTKLKYICPDNDITLSGNGKKDSDDSDNFDEDDDFENDISADGDGDSGDSDDESENQNSGSGNGKKNSKKGKAPAHTEFDDYFEAAQQSELWENDEMQADRINFEIERAKKTNQWGSFSGDMIEEIIASMRIPMDYRRILSQFRATIISQRRKLTRMKPNRRYGFDYMGSKFEPKTKLMVGVDVSGSISNEDLQHFYSVINQFFSYGVESIKVISFDSEIKQEVELRKAKKNIKITGRGGTKFQPIIDRYENANDFQGLIIFTDGYAEKPVLSKKKDILWILTGKDEYNYAKDWISELRNKATWIPSKK